MKYYLPYNGRNVTQVASNLLICRAELFQNSILSFTIIEWNQLAPDVRNLKIYFLFATNFLAL